MHAPSWCTACDNVATDALATTNVMPARFCPCMYRRAQGRLAAGPNSGTHQTCNGCSMDGSEGEWVRV
eukprot:3219957-Pyramimonas_sp.AAC.1